jgi:hypothetical protein
MDPMTRTPAVALLLLATTSLPARAAEPTGQDPRVEAIRWAQPFTLQTPHRYRHTATPSDVTHGFLIELAVAPETQRPRQIGVPGLWVGDHLAVRFNWDHQTGCSVVWVPRAPEDGLDTLAEQPVLFGSTTLPERMDDEQRAVEHETARRNGWGSVPVRDATAARLDARDFRDVAAAAADRIEACSGAESDKARLDALRAR